MANMAVRDGAGATKYIAQTGVGTDGDPFVRLVGGTVTANPPTPALTTISGVCALLGANIVVAAPAAGSHHLLYAFQFQAADAPTVRQTVLLMDGATELWNFSTTAIDGAILIFFPEGQELPFASATAIVLDLAEAKAVSYVLRYRTVAD